MAFRLRRGRCIGEEARRLIDRQLASAITCLRDPKAGPEHDSIREARRHVKKARAVLRLVRSSLGLEYGSANRRLRAVTRMLGELADARTMPGTLENMLDLDPTVPAQIGKALREQLIGRAATLEQHAQFDRLRYQTLRLLAAERDRVPTWTLKVRRNEVITAIEQSHRSARAAMREALQRPTAGAFHAWRRRAKGEWYLLRLIAARCGDQLNLDERRLEALDACLGELHDVSLLQGLVASDSALSRRETAHMLLALRRYRRNLRREARDMRHILDEGSGIFGGRVREAWGTPPADGTAPEATGVPWPRVA